MSKSQLKIFDGYCLAFRDLIVHKTARHDPAKEPWDSFVRRSLCLTKAEDWDFLCTAMDILEDTSTAVENFLIYGLSGPTKLQDVGEKYLRLYGLLNAIYMQQQALENLCKLMNVPNQSEVKNKFASLQITEVRHKLGAHGTNYRRSHKEAFKAFVPTRVTMTDFHIEYSNNTDHTFHDVNLKDVIDEHIDTALDFFDNVYSKAVFTIYKSNPDKVTTIMLPAEYLRRERKGDLAIDVGDHKVIYRER